MGNKMIEKAIEAALLAGEAILEVYAQDFSVEYKEDESPLTQADKAAHTIISQILEPIGLPVLSEESAQVPFEKRKDWDLFWLVDPLDGTKEFIKRNGEFTVNIALIKKGHPVMGVVYVPVERVLFFADEKGAFKAKDQVHFSGKDDLMEKVTKREGLPLLNVSRVPHSPLRVVASKSHCNEDTRDFIDSLKKKYGEVETVSRGSSLKLCMVAEGSADIYPRIAPTMEWDTAAAHAIVNAAGGSVHIFGSSDPLVYNKENLLNPYFVVNGIGSKIENKG